MPRGLRLICEHDAPSRREPSADDADTTRRSQIMGLDDKIKNAAQDIVGKAKEAIGNATDNDKLAAEGKADQVKADAKKAAENTKDTFK
jgi:uncharacterized protein YjbJ (UPF0337 family)